MRLISHGGAAHKRHIEWLEGMYKAMMLSRAGKTSPAYVTQEHVQTRAVLTEKMGADKEHPAAVMEETVGGHLECTGSLSRAARDDEGQAG